MSLIVLAAPLTVAWAAESHEEPNELLSWGVGIAILVVLTAVMAGLAAFGGGREHS